MVLNNYDKLEDDKSQIHRKIFETSHRMIELSKRIMVDHQLADDTNYEKFVRR